MKAWPRYEEVRSSGWSGSEEAIEPPCSCWPGRWNSDCPVHPQLFVQERRSAAKDADA